MSFGVSWSPWYVLSPYIGRSKSPKNFLDIISSEEFSGDQRPSCVDLNVNTSLVLMMVPYARENEFFLVLCVFRWVFQLRSDREVLWWGFPLRYAYVSSHTFYIDSNWFFWLGLSLHSCTQKAQGLLWAATKVTQLILELLVCGSYLTRFGFKSINR